MLGAAPREGLRDDGIARVEVVRLLEQARDESDRRRQPVRVIDEQGRVEEVPHSGSIPTRPELAWRSASASSGFIQPGLPIHRSRRRLEHLSLRGRGGPAVRPRDRRCRSCGREGRRPRRSARGVSSGRVRLVRTMTMTCPRVRRDVPILTHLMDTLSRSAQQGGRRWTSGRVRQQPYAAWMTEARVAQRYDAVDHRWRPQRPHQRRLPRAGRAEDAGPREAPRPRRRGRHRGDLPGLPVLASSQLRRVACSGRRSSASSSCPSTASTSCRSTARSRRCAGRGAAAGGGDYLWRVNDHGRTIRELRRWSAVDAEAYEEYGQLMVEMARFIKPILAIVPPDPTGLDPRPLLPLAGPRPRASSSCPSASRRSSSSS